MSTLFYNKFCNLFKYGDSTQVLFHVYITYLFIKFDESWFKQLLNLISVVLWVLHVTKTFAHVGLRWQKVFLNGSWKSMEWNSHIFSVSYFFKFYMGHLFVAHISWIVCGHVSR